MKILYLFLVYFLFESCNMKQGNLHDQTPVPLNLRCLNFSEYYDSVKATANKANLKDTSLYKCYVSGVPAYVFSLNENKLDDGIWIFYRDSFYEKPIIIAEISNKKLNGKLVYYDSSNGVYQYKSYKYGKLDGLSLYYDSPCSVEQMHKYQNGKRIDTLYGFNKSGRIISEVVYNKNGEEEKLIHYWRQWPHKVRMERIWFGDSLNQFVERRFNEDGMILEQETKIISGETFIGVNNIYNLKGEIYKSDTIHY